MTLEAALQANTEALNNVAALLEKYQAPIAVEANSIPPKDVQKMTKEDREAEDQAQIDRLKQEKLDDEKANAKAETKTASKAKEKSKRKVEAKPATKQPETSGSESEASPTEPLKYDDIKASIIKLAQAKGRDAVLEVLNEFDAKSGKDLAVADWKAAYEKLNAKLAEAE